LQNELDRAQRYGHALSLRILDLDNFKLFNDTYGHIAGDNVLVRAGGILRRSLGKPIAPSATAARSLLLFCLKRPDMKP
jgi:diguanylate cyclase (GGDEF)-like protein